jgi:hypothetical protein
MSLIIHVWRFAKMNYLWTTKLGDKNVERKFNTLQVLIRLISIFV